MSDVTREELPGGGATGELIRRLDWAATALGPRAAWPSSPKTIVRTMLHARQPMLLWWGPELIQIYNDAMLVSMGDKHPGDLGRPAREAWHEVWGVVGAQLEAVVSEGAAIWNEDVCVPVHRHGRLEDAWWTYNYSPAFDDEGARAGILIICTETTPGVVARAGLGRANRQAEAAREELRDAFLQAPIAIAILVGVELEFLLANAAYEAFVGRPVVGKRLADAFSDAEVEAYRPLLERVYRTGEPLTVEAAELRLEGAPVRYIDVGYSPYRDAAGATIGVIVLVSDVTAAVSARKLAESQREERAAMFEREQALRLAAEESGRARDEFLAMLSHELRNPLAPIATAAELMRVRGDHYPHERAIIERQVAHVAQLVDDLLDVARVTRGKLELRREPVDVADVISRALEQVAPLVAARGHVVDAPRASEPLYVDGDPVRLAQVVANILTNAAKFTPPHGRIEVHAAREGAEVAIRIGDNGSGFDPALLPRIFDLFVQGARGADRAEGGLGLGLALVKRLVAMHGGTVTARNRPAGGGELEIRLPAIAVRTAGAAPAPTPTPAAGPVHRILVVDDNEDAADMLAEILRQRGHDVAVAHDGSAALAALAASPADTAFLDIGLPGMDGYGLARRIRASPGGGRMRLVALTGYGQPSDRAGTSAAGFDAHLIKPVAVAQLLRLLT